jgi:hypothetical protein
METVATNAITKSELAELAMLLTTILAMSCGN